MLYITAHTVDRKELVYTSTEKKAFALNEDFVLILASEVMLRVVFMVEMRKNQNVAITEPLRYRQRTLTEHEPKLKNPKLWVLSHLWFMEVSCYCSSLTLGWSEASR